MNKSPWGKHRRHDEFGQLPPWPQVFVAQGGIIRELPGTATDEDNIYETEVIA